MALASGSGVQFPTPGWGAIHQVTTPALVTLTRISYELCFMACVCVPACSVVSDSLRLPGV